MKKDIFTVKSLDELKECGKLVEVREVYKEKASPLGIKGRTNSWQAMFESVTALAKLLAGGSGVGTKVTVDDSYDDLYFKSEAAKLIFFLAELDGEARMDKLNVTKRLYREADKAKEWRDNIIKVIHPDVCHHPKAARATEVVNEIYSRMVQR